MAKIQAPRRLKTTPEARKPGSKTPTLAASGPLKRHRRSWKVTIVSDNLEQQLEDVGFRTSLRAVQQILDRCPAGHKLTVESYEVTVPEISAEDAKAFLAAGGLVPCCGCAFASWALAHGMDVSKKVTWITEMVQEGAGGKKLAIALADKTVYTIGAPESLRQGMMLLVISKAQAAKHRPNKA